jgi:hypothetical protein
MAYALRAWGLECATEVLSGLRLDEFDHQLIRAGDGDYESPGTARRG